MRYLFPATMFLIGSACGWAGHTLLQIARQFPTAPGAWLAWVIGALLLAVMLGFAAMAGQDLAEAGAPR